MNKKICILALILTFLALPSFSETGFELWRRGHKRQEFPAFRCKSVRFDAGRRFFDSNE